MRALKAPLVNAKGAFFYAAFPIALQIKCPGPACVSQCDHTTALTGKITRGQQIDGIFRVDLTG